MKSPNLENPITCSLTVHNKFYSIFRVSTTHENSNSLISSSNTYNFHIVVRVHCWLLLRLCVPPGHADIVQKKKNVPHSVGDTRVKWHAVQTHVSLSSLCLSLALSRSLSLSSDLTDLRQRWTLVFVSDKSPGHFHRGNYFLFMIFLYFFYYPNKPVNGI
jgi:hypothetical protein